MRFSRFASCIRERSRRLLFPITLILLFTFAFPCQATVISATLSARTDPQQQNVDVKSKTFIRPSFVFGSNTNLHTRNDTAVPDILDEMEEIRLNGRCSCPSLSFERRFQQSYGSVRTVIEQVKVIPTQIPQLKQLEYIGRSTARYKGPVNLSDGNRFKIRAFTNPDLCGLRFTRNKEYLLNLNNPWTTNSMAGSVPRGTYFISQCDKAYTWQGLSVQQQSFLRARRQ